jgi:hypothetical protein
MPSTDTNRRLRPGSMYGLDAVTNYITGRPEATPAALQTAHDEMVAAQREETEILARAKAASDKARLAEWQFHTNVLAMKESVRGQFGSDQRSPGDRLQEKIRAQASSAGGGVRRLGILDFRLTVYLSFAS